MSESTGFLYQHLPWNFITSFHEGVVVQKDGILQRTFAYRAPDVDSSSAPEINTLAVRVNDFAKRLGSGWAFHVEAQRFFTQDYPKAEFEYPQGSFGLLAPYLVDREREAAFRAAGKHFESSYFITFTWRPPSENVKKLMNMFIQSADDSKGQNLRENADYFVNETNAVAAVLASNMLLAPLDNEQTVAYLHSSVSLNRHYIRFPHNSIMLDKILPDAELQNSLTMKLGDYWIPIVGVNDFPEETYPAILDSLNRLKLEYRWVSRYISTDKEEGKKEAQDKEKSHRGSGKTFFQTFSEATTNQAVAGSNHGASVKEQDAIGAGIEIDTDIASLGYITTSIMVWNKSLKTAKEYADAVKAVINSAGFTCKTETFNALEAWKAMMPGQIYANFRSLPVMSYSLSHVVPLSSVWAGMRRNEHAGIVSGCDIPHLICSTSEGTPFFLNLNPSDVGHAAIWGPTGAGKSTLLNLLELQFFKYPESLVIVFDKGRSCRQPCLACGGLFYEPASENSASVAFQPLRDLDTDTDLLNAIDFVESLFSVNDCPVTPQMRAAIKESLELLRDKPVNARTLTSFIQYCDYQDPVTKQNIFAEQLGDYLWDGGKYGKIFDAAASDISLDTRFLAFEMEALMNQGPGCVVPALVYLFNTVEKMFDGRLTLLILDEAWLFLSNEIFSRKIAEWLKVLRKKNVFVVFATQDVADVERSPLKTTVIQQCLTKIYLADPNATSPGMMPVYSAFGLTDSEIVLISSATMKQDYFYTSPLGRRLFQLSLGPLTLALIGSPDHKLLDSVSNNIEPGSPLCADILFAKRINFNRFIALDAPKDPEPLVMSSGRISFENNSFNKDLQPAKIAYMPFQISFNVSELFDALNDAGRFKTKSGAGKAAASIARKFSISLATVYQAKKILAKSPPETIEAVKSGSVSIKAAYKQLAQKTAGTAATEEHAQAV